MRSTLGQTVRKRRKSLGLSQAEVGEKLGVSVQTISRWETDHGMPDISQIVPLAKLLRVSTDVLLGMEQSEEETIQAAYKEIHEMWRTAALGIDHEHQLKRWDFQKSTYEKLRRLAKKYPENDHLLFECAGWAVRYLNDTYRLISLDEKELTGICSDAEKMLKTVLERENGVSFKAEAKLLLAQVYSHMGEKEKADEVIVDLTYTEKLWSRYKQAIILSDLQAQLDVGKERFYYGFQCANVGFASLYTAYSVMGGDSRRIAIEIKEKHIEFIKLFYGTVPDFIYYYHLCEGYGRLAIEHLRDSEFDECLDNIEIVCENCCALAELVLSKKEESGKNSYRIHNDIELAPFGGKSDPESVVRVLRNYIIECQKECTNQDSNPINTSERYEQCLVRIDEYLRK